MKNLKIDSGNVILFFGIVNVLATMLFSHYDLEYLPNNPELNILSEKERSYIFRILEFHSIIMIRVFYVMARKN